MSERALAHELTTNQEKKSTTYLILLADLQIKRKQYDDALESLEQALVLEHEVSFVLRKMLLSLRLLNA